MPKQPVVTVNNPVGAAAVRTAGQTITGGFIVEGLLAFNVALTQRQAVWLTAAFGIGIATAQNLLERWRGRRLIGVAS